MAEYIEREAAKKAIMDYMADQTVSKYASSAECKAARSGAEGAFNEIDYIPAADVVEVVRCVECKHYGFTKIAGEAYMTCTSPFGLADPASTDFCSGGERREE